MRAILVTVAAIAVSTSLVASARAGDKQDTALAAQVNTHLERAVEFYAEKQYELAIVEFRAAFALDPRPDLLFALAQAERLSGDCPSAVVYYERYLETDPDDEQAEAARVNAKKCERALESGPRGRPDKSTNESLDDAESASEPATPAPIAQSLAALAPGGGGVPWYRDTMGDALLVSGVAGLAIGAGFFAASSSAEDRAKSSVEYEDYVAHIDVARQRGNLAIAGFAVGGALVTAAVIRFVTRGKSKSKTETVPTIGATPAPGGIVVSAAASF